MQISKKTSKKHALWWCIQINIKKALTSHFQLKARSGFWMSPRLLLGDITYQCLTCSGLLFLADFKYWNDG